MRLYDWWPGPRDRVRLFCCLPVALRAIGTLVLLSAGVALGSAGAPGPVTAVLDDPPAVSLLNVLPAPASPRASGRVALHGDPPPSTEVFSTLGTDNEFNSTSAIRIADPGSVFGTAAALELAVPFTTADGGLVQSLEVAVARSIGSATSATLRRLSLRTDSGGQPGEALEAWDFVPGSQARVVRLLSAKRPELAAGGAYWVVGEINPDGTAGDNWYLNTIRASGQALARRSPAADWQTTVLFYPALRIRVGPEALPPENQPPVLVATATPGEGVAPLEVSFTAEGSADPDGTITAYQWDFGDGESVLGSTATHLFPFPGTYRVTLSAADDAGATAQVTVQVRVAVSNVETETAFSTFGFNDTFNFVNAIRIADPDSVFGTYGALELAVPFTSSADGPLESLEIPIARSLGSATSKSPRRFRLFSDADGDLGDPLESWDLLPRQAPSITTLGSTNKPLLTAGARYWLVAEINPQGTAGDNWYQNVVMASGNAFARRSPVARWEVTRLFYPALRVRVGTGTPPPENKAPIAKASATPTTGRVPLAVTFSASGSSDPDGSIESFDWLFGDGTTGEGMTTSHTYLEPGSYTVILTVTDNGGLQTQAAVRLDVRVSAGDLWETYSTFWFGNTYNESSAIRIADPLSAFGTAGSLEMAVPFTAGIGGRLESIEIPFSRALASTTSRTLRPFRLVSSRDGELGETLESWEFLPGLDQSVVTLESTLRPLLLEGARYWVVAEITPEGTAGDNWYLNSRGVKGPVRARRSPDEPWQITSVVHPTLRVTVASDSPANEPPKARGSAAPVHGASPLTVAFSAAGSSDPEGTALAYSWNFGDGSTGTGLETDHLYARPGTYTASLTVRDSGIPPLTDTRTFVISVSEPNHPPTLTAIPAVTIAEGQELAFTVLGSDTDLPPQTLHFSLTNTPDGMTIDSATGLLQWTPTEAQGPEEYTVEVQVTDDGTPPLTASTPLHISVSEVNSPPTLAPIPAQTAFVGTTFRLPINVSDADVPPNPISLDLIEGPADAVIDSGTLLWTPAATDVGVHPIILRASDGGTPNLTATGTFVITVVEPNHPPALAAVPDLRIVEGQRLRVTALGSDPDLPPQALRYSLINAPAGMTINAETGVLDWTPAEAQGPQEYTVDVQVTDDGIPPLSTSTPLHVSVSEVNSPPSLPPIPAQTAFVGKTFRLPLDVSDPDLPPNPITFRLALGPADATFVSGVLLWTPRPTDVGLQFFSVVVSDGGNPPLEASQTFLVTIRYALEVTVMRGESDVAVAFPSLPNQRYRVEYTSDMVPTGWEVLADKIQGTGNTITIVDPQGTSFPRRYYRVAEFPAGL